MNFKLLIVSTLSLLLLSCIGDGDEPWSETFLSTIDANGDNLQHLVKDIYGEPKFSHDGEKIILANNQGFWTVNTNGTDLKCILDTLTANNNYYSISPANEILVFYQLGEIYKLNYVNGNMTKLFSYEEESAGFPSYSPDGSKILFSTTSTGLGDSTTVKLYTMNEDGSNQNLLYLNSSLNFGVIRYPTYSDNQEKILFNDTTIEGVQMCNSDGTHVNTVCDDCNYISYVTSEENYFVFSSSNNIYVYDYNTELLNNLGYGQKPDISQNSKITFYDYDLYVMDIDGTNRAKIANSSNSSQSFSNDGEKIVFYGDINHSSKRDMNPLK